MSCRCGYINGLLHVFVMPTLPYLLWTIHCSCADSVHRFVLQMSLCCVMGVEPGSRVTISQVKMAEGRRTSSVVILGANKVCLHTVPR